MTHQSSDGISSIKPLIYQLLERPLSGPRIEELSFETIDREYPHSRFSQNEWAIVRRMIHTCADFAIAENVRFSERGIVSGIAALQEGRLIYADSNMINAGISLARLQAACASYAPRDVITHVADKDIADQARESGLPRSLFAMRKVQSILTNSIVAIGNAPVALLELNRLIIEEEIKPALVVAMPVGFVHVMESKEELMSLGVPYIAIEGRRGGSSLAVSVIHALANLACNTSLAIDQKMPRHKPID